MTYSSVGTLCDFLAEDHHKTGAFPKGLLRFCGPSIMRLESRMIETARKKQYSRPHTLSIS